MLTSRSLILSSLFWLCSTGALSQGDRNPLGECNCDGELWLSEDCTLAYLCDSTEKDGGEVITCPEGEVIQVNDRTLTWGCTTNVDTCPNNVVRHKGCASSTDRSSRADHDPEECTLSANPLGICECDDQLFIDSACQTGFKCNSSTSDPFLYDGCLVKCQEHEKLVPDYETGGWLCVDESETYYLCPGRFNLECEDHGIETGLDSSQCDCNGQLIVSADCKEAFYCVSHFANGGDLHRCDDTDDIVWFDAATRSWSCEPETTHACPALGGFKMGCYGSQVTVPPVNCTPAANPFGTCGGCEGQIFVSDDCASSFYCSGLLDQDQAGEADAGCLLECGDAERVDVDYATNTWRCVPREATFTCPGLFYVDCSDHSFNDIRCNCDTELWMRHDCGQAFLCQSKDGQGQTISCPDGQVIQIDFTDIYNYTCTDDASGCPGSFHFGCQSSDITTRNPLDTTTTSAGAASLANAPVLLVVLIVNVIYYYI